MAGKPEVPLTVSFGKPIQSGQVVILENGQGRLQLESSAARKNTFVFETTYKPSQTWRVEGGPTQWTFKNMESGEYLTGTGGNNGAAIKLTNTPFKWKIKPGTRVNSFCLESAQHPNVMVCNAYGKSTNNNQVWMWAFAPNWHDMMSWSPKALPDGEQGSSGGESQAAETEKQKAALAEQEATLKQREAELASAIKEAATTKARAAQDAETAAKEAAAAQQRAIELENREASLKEREDKLQDRESKADSSAKSANDASGQRAADLEKQEAAAKARLAELEQREATLAKREAELQQREGAVDPTTKSSASSVVGGDDPPATSNDKEDAAKQAQLVEKLREQNETLTQQLGAARADLALAKAFGPGQIKPPPSNNNSSGINGTAAPATGPTPQQQAAEARRWREQSSKLDEMRDIVRAIRQTQLASLAERDGGGSLSGGVNGGAASTGAGFQQPGGGTSGTPKPRAGDPTAYVGAGAGNAPARGREFTFLKRL